MKNNSYLTFLALLLFISTLLLTSSAHAQTQSEINSAAYATYRKADKELNTVYQSILKQYAKQTLFLKKLKAAQRLWISFRAAELAARYPDAGKYGSSETVCRASYLENITRDRTKTLKVWLDGLPEGETCTGSVKRK